MQDRKQVPKEEDWIIQRSGKADFNESSKKIRLLLAAKKLESDATVSVEIKEIQRNEGRKLVLIHTENYLNSTNPTQLERNRILLNETIKKNESHLQKTWAEKTFGSKLDRLLTSACELMGDKYDPKYGSSLEQKSKPPNLRPSGF